MRTLRERVPAEKFAPTEAKINSFAAGYGTILYFDDEGITETFASNFPTYAANFKYPKNFYEPAQTILQHGRSDN